MDGLFDFIYNHLPDSWFENFHQVWGDSLTDDVVLQSVQEASDFFNMNAPIDVHEDWTTGVMTGMPFTENDDILVFNRQQMLDTGITDNAEVSNDVAKDGFDKYVWSLDKFRCGFDDVKNSFSESTENSSLPINNVQSFIYNKRFSKKAI